MNSIQPLLFSKLMFITLTTSLLSACIDEDSESGENSNLDPVNTDGTAEFVIEDIAAFIYNRVTTGLDNGQYSSVTVFGVSGQANISGTVSYVDGISCGSSCVRAENNTDLSITFDNYRARSADNSWTTLTGTVQYLDTTYNRQSGLNYSSGGSIRISGSDVTYTFTVDDDDTGYHDVIGFSSSGNTSSQSGWCTNDSGGSFSF